MQLTSGSIYRTRNGGFTLFVRRDERLNVPFPWEAVTRCPQSGWELWTLTYSDDGVWLGEEHHWDIVGACPGPSTAESFLEVVSLAAAYMALLRMPQGRHRSDLHGLMALVREQLALATGLSPQDTQDLYEELVR